LLWEAERGSKTKHGDGYYRAFNPVAQTTSNDRCPVKFYKEFSRRRPDEMKTAESPFYLAINRERMPQNPIWYAKGPLGKDEIGKFLVHAAKNSDLYPGQYYQSQFDKNMYFSINGSQRPYQLRSPSEWT
jgi:hypothetical protein